MAQQVTSRGIGSARRGSKQKQVIRTSEMPNVRAPFDTARVKAQAAAATDEVEYVGVGRRKKCSAVAKLVPGTGQVRSARSLLLVCVVPRQSERLENTSTHLVFWYYEKKTRNGAQTGISELEYALMFFLLQQVYINGRDGEEYLQSNPDNMYSLVVPLEVLGLEGRYDVYVRARGGGKTGQAQASRLAVSKALANMDPDENRPPLKREGLLSTDDRRKERKKPGLAGARRTPQYSKR